MIGDVVDFLALISSIKLKKLWILFLIFQKGGKEEGTG